MSSNPVTFDPDYAVPPGATLLETIEELSMTQTELARRMGRPLKTINEIISGAAQIMPETALQLEKVTGIPASFWNSAESKYRERLARQADDRRQQDAVGWIDQFSYRRMVDLGLVPWLNDKVGRVGQLLRYFGVATPEQWKITYATLCGAAREAAGFRAELGDLSVWLRAGELLAQRRLCKPYDKDTFRGHLRTIRRLTAKSPQEIFPEICRLCAEAGVVIVLVPELPRTHVSGFTRWLTSDKALIQLSLRYKTDDSLWFTFFHEAAHILLHGKRDVFLEFRDHDNPKEREADAWAGDFLISPQDWEAFKARLPARPDISVIVGFARQQGIAPSIVLGRLQHREKRIPPSRFNSLKHKVGIQWKGLF